MLKSPGSSFSGVALFHTCLYLRFLLLVHHHLPLRDNLCVCVVVLMYVFSLRHLSIKHN
jgi:hypothetical protein